MPSVINDAWDECKVRLGFSKLSEDELFNVRIAFISGWQAAKENIRSNACATCGSTYVRIGTDTITCAMCGSTRRKQIP